MNKNTARFAEYVQARSHPPPPILHRYTSFEKAKKIIETEQVWFASPIKFNDPLDTQWNMLWELSTPEFHRAIVERTLALDFDLGRVRDEDLRKLLEIERIKYEAMSASERQDYVRARIDELDRDIDMPARVSDQLNRLRIWCLAERPDSIQMWSYYADSHTGVVLTFDTAALENAWHLPVAKVTYADKLPPVLDPSRYPQEYIDAFAYGMEMPELNHVRGSHLWTFTKAQGWNHEAEWRFVYIADKGDTTLAMPISFPIEAIVEIALGCNGDRTKFDALAGLLLRKNPKAKVVVAGRHRGEFALVGKYINTSRRLK